MYIDLFNPFNSSIKDTDSQDLLVNFFHQSAHYPRIWYFIAVLTVPMSGLLRYICTVPTYLSTKYYGKYGSYEQNNTGGIYELISHYKSYKNVII